jgi:FAD/FMN-containing dehydrogenase
MAGNAIGGAVIDLSRHLAVVQPGVVLTDLTTAAAAYGPTFGVDPSSASRASLGEMIANSACGSYSVAGDTTADDLQSLRCCSPTAPRMDLTTPTGDQECLRSGVPIVGLEPSCLARVLLPAVRARLRRHADRRRWLSCRPQIQRETGFMPWHLAQVLASALPRQ